MIEILRCVFALFVFACIFSVAVAIWVLVVDVLDVYRDRDRRP